MHKYFDLAPPLSHSHLCTTSKYLNLLLLCHLPDLPLCYLKNFLNGSQSDLFTMLTFPMPSSIVMHMSDEPAFDHFAPPKPDYTLGPYLLSSRPSCIKRIKSEFLKNVSAFRNMSSQTNPSGSHALDSQSLSSRHSHDFLEDINAFSHPNSNQTTPSGSNASESSQPSSPWRRSHIKSQSFVAFNAIRHPKSAQITPSGSEDSGSSSSSLPSLRKKLQKKLQKKHCESTKMTTPIKKQCPANHSPSVPSVPSENSTKVSPPGKTSEKIPVNGAFEDTCVSHPEFDSIVIQTNARKGLLTSFKKNPKSIVEGPCVHSLLKKLRKFATVKHEGKESTPPAHSPAAPVDYRPPRPPRPVGGPLTSHPIDGPPVIISPGEAPPAESSLPRLNCAKALAINLSSTKRKPLPSDAALIHAALMDAALSNASFETRPSNEISTVHATILTAALKNIASAHRASAKATLGSSSLAGPSTTNATANPSVAVAAMTKFASTDAIIIDNAAIAPAIAMVEAADSADHESIDHEFIDSIEPPAIERAAIESVSVDTALANVTLANATPTNLTSIDDNDDDSVTSVATNGSFNIWSFTGHASTDRAPPGYVETGWTPKGFAPTGFTPSRYVRTNAPPLSRSADELASIETTEFKHENIELNDAKQCLHILGHQLVHEENLEQRRKLFKVGVPFKIDRWTSKQNIKQEFVYLQTRLTEYEVLRPQISDSTRRIEYLRVDVANRRVQILENVQLLQKSLTD